jgi:hypothetical protein
MVLTGTSVSQTGCQRGLEGQRWKKWQNKLLEEVRKNLVAWEEESVNGGLIKKMV